jgi:hypothetical protein
MHGSVVIRLTDADLSMLVGLHSDKEPVIDIAHSSSSSSSSAVAD